MLSSRFDALLATVRAYAQAGEWSRVLEALEGQALLELSELGLLRAEAHLRLGAPARAQEWLVELIPVLERRADRAALRRATNMLGAANWELGRLDVAESAWSRALAFAEADQDTLLFARATNNLGIVANARGQRELALGRYRGAIPAYQQLGNAVGLAESHHNMAITHRDLDELDEADEHERRAIEFATSAGHARLVALARLGQAELALRRGDVQLAGVAARRVAQEFRGLSEPNREADARRLSGLSRLRQGDVDAAAIEVEVALDLARASGAALIEGESLEALAEVAMARDDRALAERQGREALVLYERLGAAVDAARMREWLLRLREREAPGL